MNIYDKNGWLDFDKLYTDDVYNFFIIIGSRQVGKTYGTAKFILQRKEFFMWMRRTEEELYMLMTDPDKNPFTEHDPNIIIKALPKSKLCGIFKMDDPEAPEMIGYAAALTTIKTMRGFNMQHVKWLIYDEFVPEKHVRKIRKEGDAFLNAYVTISGNRELQGKKALKAILLSNSNDLSHDVLYSLHCIHDVEEMKRKKQEIKLLNKKGIAIILPKSEKIIEERKKTAIARVLSEDSEFWKMAFENDFAYNSMLYILPVDPASLIPYCKVGKLFFYQQKGTGNYYCSLVKRGVFNIEFPEGLEGVRASMIYTYPVIEAYNSGGLAFEEYTAKKLFIDTFNIKV